MSIEDNKKVALKFFETLSAGKKDALVGLLSDDATWWIQGHLPLSGSKTKAEFAALMDLMFPQFEVARVTPKGITAEGDRVAVEAESYVKLNNGKILQGTYHFLFVVRDGKIQAGKEYMDTDHARAVVFG